MMETLCRIIDRLAFHRGSLFSISTVEYKADGKEGRKELIIFEMAVGGIRHYTDNLVQLRVKSHFKCMREPVNILSIITIDYVFFCSDASLVLASLDVC